MSQKPTKGEFRDELMVEMENPGEISGKSMRVSVVSNRRDDFSYYFSHGNAD